MRRYALRNEARGEAGTLACLECYDRPRAFYIEISPEADPWDLPFVLHEHAMRGSYTVGAPWSLRWVRSRIVPRERQNLGEVLRVNGLTSYDEGLLLALTKGRCAQDDCYLVDTGTDELGTWYANRMRSRVADAFGLSGRRLLVTFRDNAAAMFDANRNYPAGASLHGCLRTRTCLLV